MADETNRPPILEAAIQHFKDQGRKRIEVSEWDAVIFAAPLTLSDREKLLKSNRGSIGMSAFVDAIILKAEDEDGGKLFTLEHKQMFMKGCDGDVVARVAGVILGSVTAGEAEKN